MNKKNNMNKINSIIYLISIIFLGWSLQSCNPDKNPKEEIHGHDEHESEENILQLNERQVKALNLEFGSIKMRNISSIVKINGRLQVPPENKAEIFAIIGGQVKNIRVFIGDFVKKGQVLATLEHPDYISLQEDFAVEANRLDFLEQDYLRQKELYENHVGAGKDFQQARSEYHIAKARYEGLKARLLLLNLSPEKVKNGEITGTIDVLSPISGYVNRIHIKIGTYVDTQSMMFEVVDKTAIHADFAVYEKDVHLLSPEQIIHFTVSNRPEKEYEAKIFAIGKQFDEKSKAVHIHALIAHASEDLIPGMYITGHLHTNDDYTQTLPIDAIVNEGTKSYIFIVDHDEHEHDKEHEHENEEVITFKMIEIVSGQKDDMYSEIELLEDLPQDAQIVMNKAYYLLADMKKEETEH